MRWILFILFCLLGAPAHAVSIPGVTTTTTTDSTTEPAPEPDIEQKKAAYGALADVLDNDTSRKELIDQLRTVAATPPAEPVPKIVPPTLVEEQTVLQKVTEVSRHYGEALSARFGQLYRNITGSPHKPNLQQCVDPFFNVSGISVWFLLADSPVRTSAVSQNGPVGAAKKS